MARTATKREKSLATCIFLVSLVVLVAAAPSSGDAATSPAAAWQPTAPSSSAWSEPAAPAIAPSYPETRNRVSGKLEAARDQVSSELSRDLRQGYEQSSGWEAAGSLDAPGRGVGLADEVVQTPWGSRNVRTGKWSGGGRAGVDPVDDFIEHALDNGYEVVGREIDIRTPFGTRRADLVLRHIESGRVGGIEIKSTLAEFNKFNRGQFAKDRFINSFGGRAFGVNAETADLTLVDYMMKIMWGAR